MWLERNMLLLAAVAACAALSLPSVASADDGGEVRKAGSCTASSTMNVRLRADDGKIRVELEIEGRQRGAAWTVILLRERRIAFRGVIHAREGSREARLRRTFDDWFGRDSIVIRASGPRAETCRVSAAI
jgi:2-methylaconitate cis-trans-isomerase PrpF